MGLLINDLFVKLIEKVSPSLYDKYFIYHDAKNYYYMRTGKKLSYKQVSNISEKLFWIQRYWQNPLIVQCADKYRMREYVKQVGLEKILVPLLGVYDNVNDIDFDNLPSKFVLKCTHGCGYNTICTDKNELNIENTKKTLNKWMSEVYGKEGFELHYSKIKPKIICEEYLDFSKPENAVDYKIHCINGVPFCFLICFNRDYINHTVELASYSLDWEKLNYLKKESQLSLPKPKYLDKMIEYATALSQAFPYVRVDMYYINDKIYIGELTFTPAGNIMNYYNDSTLELMGHQLTLPAKYKG